MLRDSCSDQDVTNPAPCFHRYGRARCFRRKSDLESARNRLTSDDSCPQCPEVACRCACQPGSSRDRSRTRRDKPRRKCGVAVGRSDPRCAVCKSCRPRDAGASANGGCVGPQKKTTFHCIGLVGERGKTKTAHCYGGGKAS